MSKKLKKIDDEEFVESDEEEDTDATALIRRILRDHRNLNPRQIIAVLLITCVAFLFWAIFATAALASERQSHQEKIQTAQQADSWVRTAVVMRHCVRSTKPTAPEGSPAPFLDNYSAKPFPQWGVPIMSCVPRGLEIVKNQGVFMKGQGGLPGLKMALDKITIVADGMQRNMESAVMFASGVGGGGVSGSASSNVEIHVDWNSKLYDPYKAKVCAPYSASQLDALLEEQLDENPIPEGHEELVQVVQNLLGKGSYPVALDKIADVIENGTFAGGSAIASAVVETWLMEMGAGMSVGWGEVSPSDVYRLLSLHVWYRTISVRNRSCLRRIGPVWADMKKWLSTQSGSETLVYLGHDTTIDELAAALELSWSPQPFPDNAAPPSSMLVLQVNGVKANPFATTVSAYFGYTDLTTTDGEIKLVPAKFSKAMKNVMFFDDLLSDMLDRVGTLCVPKS